MHVELNVYLFEAGPISHAIFNVNQCATDSQYAQFNLTATHESKQHIKRFEEEFKATLAEEIVSTAKMEYYRLSDLTIMTSNHLEELIFVEFYILPRDKLSTPDSPTVSMCMTNLNETINLEKFVIDMSGFTGKNDRFNAIPNSLGLYSNLYFQCSSCISVDCNILYVNTGVKYNTTIVYVGHSTGQTIGFSLLAAFISLVICITGQIFYLKYRQ